MIRKIIGISIFWLLFTLPAALWLSNPPADPASAYRPAFDWGSFLVAIGFAQLFILGVAILIGMLGLAVWLVTEEKQ